MQIQNSSSKEMHIQEDYKTKAIEYLYNKAKENNVDAGE